MIFWETLQKLVDESVVVIDRRKDSAPPTYDDYIYPFDYGYLSDTVAPDGHGIDCWVGSLGGTTVTGIIPVVDPVKRDSEMKVLLGCTMNDMQIILACHQRGNMQAMLIEKID